MAALTGARAPRLTAVMREGERVTPLELFFDLVFVLAITQCTARMSHDPTWPGLAQGLLVLRMFWWGKRATGFATRVRRPPWLLLELCCARLFDSTYCGP